MKGYTALFLLCYIFGWYDLQNINLNYMMNVRSPGVMILSSRGVAKTFLLGGCEGLNLPTAPLHFFLEKFCQKVDPLKICAAKSDKQK